MGACRGGGLRELRAHWQLASLKSQSLHQLTHHPPPNCHRFIRVSRPDAATGAYRLATAFPPAQLEDDSATIEAAGLANSVVVQKR